MEQSRDASRTSDTLSVSLKVSLRSGGMLKGSKGVRCNFILNVLPCFRLFFKLSIHFFPVVL